MAREQPSSPILEAHWQRISDYDVEQRKRFVGLGSDDLARILALKNLVAPRAQDHANAFFDFLSRFPETQPLFGRSELLAEVRRRKHEHLIAMVQGDYGRSYVEERVRLGVLYSQVALDTRLFLGAFHHLMESIGATITVHFGQDSDASFRHLMSLKKVAFFDIGIIVDVLTAERERTISMQQESIRELSTPVLQLRERLLILPIIGMIDTLRARQLTENLLRSIRDNRAKVVVIDVTGVAMVDSKVANHLIQTAAASRLMGAAVIITGLSAEIAQTLVNLGVDLGALNTLGDLQGGLESAERLLGYKVVPIAGPPEPTPPV
jgi:rsbT co-antagonist protein RsbR